MANWDVKISSHKAVTSDNNKRLIIKNTFHFINKIVT